MGYLSDYSRSERAAEAEREGKLPLSRAIPVLSRELEITQKQAKSLLLSCGPCEWHHTSSRYNCTDYYDVNSVIEGVQEGDLEIPLPEKREAKAVSLKKSGTVTWTEWSGTRSYPIPSTHSAVGVVEYWQDKPMCTVTLADGRIFKKKYANIKVSTSD